MAEPAPAPRPEAAKQPLHWRRWGIAAAIAILVLFMALNAQQVKVDLIFGSARMPLIFAILIAAVLGAIVGWAAPRLRANRRRD